MQLQTDACLFVVNGDHDTISVLRLVCWNMYLVYRCSDWLLFSLGYMVYGI